MSLLQCGFALLLGAFAGACLAADTEHARAAQACEDAVASTIDRLRGREARDLQFAGTKRAIAADGEEIGVKGEGHYRRGAGGAAQAFTYSCAFNTKTGETSGVVLKEAANATPSDARAWQPDLTNVSPDTCETAVAALLKDQHPRVGSIAFRSETRRLQPAASARIGLEGQGTLQRAPGMNPSGFKYRCEFDPRSGKLLAAHTD